jgi:hypothetical protein
MNKTVLLARSLITQFKERIELARRIVTQVVVEKKVSLRPFGELLKLSGNFSKFFPYVWTIAALSDMQG